MCVFWTRKGEGSFSSQFLQILLDNMHEQPFLPKQTILQEGKELFSVGLKLPVLVLGSSCGCSSVFTKSKSGSVCPGEFSHRPAAWNGRSGGSARSSPLYESLQAHFTFCLFVLGRSVAFILPTSWHRPSSASAGSWSPGRPLQPRRAGSRESGAETERDEW